MSEKVVWHYLKPTALDYCMKTGLRRDILRKAAGHFNRKVGAHDTTRTNQIGLKGEYAFAAECGLALPTAGQPDPGYDFMLGRYRIDVKTNGTLKYKNLLCPDDGKSAFTQKKCDIVLAAGTADLNDPWVCLIGWISVASWEKQKQHHLLMVLENDGSRRPVPTWIIRQELLNEMADLPSWPGKTTPRPAPPYQKPEGEQNPLL